MLLAGETRHVAQVFADYEAAYQHLLASARELTFLLSYEAAPCESIRTYNRQMIGLYHAQVGLLEILRASGVDGVPNAPPYPTLFAVQGVDGDRALDIECEKLPEYVGYRHIRVITSAADTQAIEGRPGAPRINAPAAPTGLGAVPIVAIGVIVIAGIAVYVLPTAITAISEHLRTRAISADSLAAYKSYVEQQRYLNELRAELLRNCLERGRPPEKCRDTAAKGMPDAVPPDFYKYLGKPKTGHRGLIWWIGVGTLVGVLAVGGYVLYRRRRQRQAAGRTGRIAART